MSINQDGLQKERNVNPAARKVMTLMLLSFKNFSLYPETHTICINCIRNLKKALDEFFNKELSFKFGIEKDRLLFQGDPLYHHTGEASSENMPGILYRDGVRRVEFRPGIEAYGLSRFFSILQAYRFLDDEPEGDLVTALWEADLGSIDYDAVLYWEVEPLSQFPAVGPVEQPLQDTRQLMERSENEGSQLPGPGSVPLVRWQLNENEICSLQKMIAQEEEWDATHDVLDVLLDILEQQHESEDFSVVLEFLGEEYLNGLANREFGFSAKLVVYTERIRRQFAQDHPWAVPYLEGFFEKISGPDAADAIRRTLIEEAKPVSDPVLKEFKVLLRHLRPDMVSMLAPMMVETRSPRLQQVFMEGIAHLLNRDLRPAENLLGSKAENLVRMLAHILGYLKGEDVERLLLRMLRHPAAKVRKQALKSLMKRSPVQVESLFFLIDDPDASIRRLLLNHLRKRPLPSAEPLLLNYLEARKCVSLGREHILACYSALGACASSDTLPFLENVLLNRMWSGFFGGNQAYRKEGAARALAAMNLEEARVVLHKASRCLAPHIRKISKQVMEEEVYGR